MFEIVYDTLSVEEVHRRCQEIPIERLCKSEVSGFARNIGNRDNFFEGNDLDGCDDCNNVDMTSEHGCKEQRDHNKRPYRSSDEALSFLFIFGLLGQRRLRSISLRPH